MWYPWATVSWIDMLQSVEQQIRNTRDSKQLVHIFTENHAIHSGEV